MLCPSCKNSRPTNSAPCPWCNAPVFPGGDAQGGPNAPFASQGQAGPANSWGGPGTPANGWGASSSGMQQLSPSFSGPGARPGSGPFWPQAPGGGPETQNGQPAGQSLLPVPYQGQQGSSLQGMMAMPTGFPTFAPGVQPVQSLAPVLPDEHQEAAVYIAPMYTNPRPIIPRYRAISGLLSVLIVFVLLCSGSAYFAQVTGKLTPFEKLLGIYAPPSMASTTHAQALPVPPMQQTAGPGNTVIYSVGLGTSIDAKSGQVPTYVNQFVVGQTIYLTCSLTTAKPGTITIKLYTNGNYDSELPQKVVANTSGTIPFKTTFGIATEGRADIYWNDQLAATAFFVVEPLAQ